MADSPADRPEMDPRYVAARRVLLDALTALAPHGPAIIVAGAQAVYLRTGTGDLSIAPFTTDGDLALNPSLLGAEPALEETMTKAGFQLLPREGGHVEPGIWIAKTHAAGAEIVIPIDLIVPEGAADKRGRRGARLGTHGTRAARRAVGLEAALVDHTLETIAALEEEDPRSIVAAVAGPAALFVAKLHKLHDRVASDRPGWLDDKDAADIVRLVMATSPAEVGATIKELSEHEVAGPPSLRALAYIDELFGARGRPGIKAAARALRIALPEERVEAICIAYTVALLHASGERH